MSVFSGPEIVSDGLLLALDASNVKSYRNYNLANYSQDFTNAVYSKSTGLVSATGLLAPDSTMTATTLTDDVNGTYESFGRGFTVTNDSSSYNISVYIKKTTGGTSTRTGFNISFSTGGTTKSYNVRFNADTGVITGGDSNLVTSENNNYWRLSFVVSNNGTGNTVFAISYYPATGFYDGTDNAAAMGSHTVWGFQVTRGAVLLPYNMNVDDSVNIWYDLARNNNGTLTNGPTFNSDYSGSLLFDETNDYVSISNFSIQAHTICAFIRTNKLNDFQGIFGQADNIWSNLSIALRIKNNNTVNYVLSGSGTASGNYSEYETNFQLSSNTWYYVCSTFSRPNRSIYLNGIEQQCSVASGTSTVDYDLYNSSSNIIIGGYAYSIGAGAGGLGYLFSGNINNLSLYNRALSAAEIQQNFNALRGRFGV